MNFPSDQHSIKRTFDIINSLQKETSDFCPHVITFSGKKSVTVSEYYMCSSKLSWLVHNCVIVKFPMFVS